MDVLFVGAGPAGLAGAIELAKLVKADGTIGDVNIGVLEKAGALGEHSLSGAIVNPRAFRELFPDVPESEWPFRQRVDREAVYLLTEGGSVKIPTPPTMKNHGNYAASLSEVVRWMGERAEALGVNVFPGFPADALLVDGSTVRGVRTTPTGLNREREPGDGYMDPADLTAKVTVLTEGTRGTLGQAWRAVAEGVVTQSPDLRAGREGSLAGPAARSIASSTRWAGRSRATHSADRSCTRWVRRRWRSGWWWGSTTTARGSTCTSCSSG